MDFLETLEQYSKVAFEILKLDNKEDKTPEDEARLNRLIREHLAYVTEVYKTKKAYPQLSNSAIMTIIDYAKANIGSYLAKKGIDLLSSSSPAQETVSVAEPEIPKPPVQPLGLYCTTYPWSEHTNEFYEYSNSLYENYCARILDCVTEDDLFDLNDKYLKMAKFITESDHARKLQSKEKQ